MNKFETFSTTADVGIRIQGEGYESLFNNAVKGTNLLLFGQDFFGSPKEGSETYPFEFKGDNAENILVNLLSEVLFLVQSRNKVTRGMYFRELNETTIKVDLMLTPLVMEPELEIKAVTYHNLKIVDHPEGVKAAEVVFDI